MEEGGAHCGDRPKLVADAGGADFISALPEDLRLQVLRRLDCARAAARNSLLSRHWRDLWRRIADFTFRDVALHSLLPVLHSLSASDVFLLDIHVPEVSPDLSPLHEQHATRVSSLIHAAADLSPLELRFGVPPTTVQDLFFHSVCHSLTLHLPCFLHTTTIQLHGLNLLFTELPCMFPALETLSLSACHVDFHALVLQCPCLRVLRATDCLHGNQDITIHSASLRELIMESTVVDFEGLGAVSVLAPVVEKVSWSSMYVGYAVAGIGRWGLATDGEQCLVPNDAIYLLL